MQFDSGQSIYLQISDYVCEQILRGHWKPGDRIPSIREMAVSVEVNPNTVTRAYTLLGEEGIIENRRGIGYFVTPGGFEATASAKRRRFEQEELPRVFRTMRLLGMSAADLAKLYERYCMEEDRETND
ncbi:MAG: GntR family transcriptional regulator [Spirochaetota bacterium]